MEATLYGSLGTGSVNIIRSDRIPFGFFRLQSGRKDDLYAVEYDKDGEAVLFVFLQLRPRGKYEYTVKLRNLEETAVYAVEEDGRVLEKSGAYLMNHGLVLNMRADFSSKCIHLKKR